MHKTRIISLSVKVKTGQRTTSITLEGDRLIRVQLKASPIKNAANDALIHLLADFLKIRKSDIAIRLGKTSKQKLLYIKVPEQNASAILALLTDPG